MNYLDNSATTKICEPALKAYVETSTKCFGNPSSKHHVGMQARKMLDESKRCLLESVKGKGEIVFLSSGTEANNLCILGRAHAKERFKNKKILTTAGEHSSVLQPMQQLASEGFEIVYLSTKDGKIDLEEVKKACDDNLILASIMMVNNETGAIYPIEEIGKILHENAKNAIFHVDATQSYMKMPIDVKKMHIDALTVCSHKVEGPKGVAALYIGQDLMTRKDLAPLVYGGGQGSGLYSGTENLPGIVGFAEAVRYKSAKMAEEKIRIEKLRMSLLERLNTEGLTSIKPVLCEAYCPYVMSLTLGNIKSETMLNYLSSKDICVSSGSACSSHEAHLSRALLAFGLTEKEADTTIRVSFGSQNTEEDVKMLCDALKEGIARLSKIR